MTVIDITRKHLEELGHDVYIFAPAGAIRKDYAEDPHVVRFPAVKGAFFDDYRTSIFFPPRMLKKIKELKLDVIQFFTPGQVGLMAVYAGRKLNIITIAQHSTDVYEYIDHYPMAIPGVFLLSSIIPFTVKLDTEQKKQLAKLFMPAKNRRKWGRRMIEGACTMLYGACDATIALSPKSRNQIEQWRGADRIQLELIPTGVDALQIGTTEEAEEFRKNWGISADDLLVSYIGRLGSEKNLEILFPMIVEILKSEPRAKLLLVGDFEHGEELKSLARESGAIDRIVFTGMLPRETLGAIYGTSDVFVFPSLTDTQGLVLHEAAHAGLPIVLVDRDLSQVLIDGENGFIAEDTPESLAKSVLTILEDDELRERFGLRSKELACQFSELGQTKKLVELYQHLGA
ncbi:MAG: glycosyltransferase [Microbacteriaceae bacterium]